MKKRVRCEWMGFEPPNPPSLATPLALPPAVWFVHCTASVRLSVLAFTEKIGQPVHVTRPYKTYVVLCFRILLVLGPTYIPYFTLTTLSRYRATNKCSLCLVGLWSHLLFSCFYPCLLLLPGYDSTSIYWRLRAGSRLNKWWWWW